MQLREKFQLYAGFVAHFLFICNDVHSCIKIAWRINLAVHIIVIVYASHYIKINFITMTATPIVSNEALIDGILGGSFIIIIMIVAIAAIGGILAYIKKKLQANVVIQSDSNL